MLNFPDSPALNQIFTAAGKSWGFDGEKWTVAFVGAVGTDVLLANASVFLPVGFNGFVQVENATGATLTVTLPTVPYPGERVLIKDTIGNASTYHITVAGGGSNIEGQLTVTITYNYGWLNLIYTGILWVQV